MTLQETIERDHNSDTAVETHSVTIIPENAAEYLEDYNDENRPLSKSLAKQYANEFLRGEWNETGENLIYGLDDEGVVHLISGQHRLVGLLHAKEVLDSEPKYWKNAVLILHTEVTTGVSMTAADSVDKGKSRSHVDVLYRSPIIDNAIPDAWNNNQVRRTKWCKCLATAA